MEEEMKNLIAVVILAFACGAAHSQAYPVKPVRMVVPFAPGGATDVIARIMAGRLQEGWGQSVIVDNRPGAGNVIGTDVVAKAPPDGYTIGVVVTSHLANPSLRNDLPYDTLRDFAGVIQLAVLHIAVAVHPSLPVNNIQELLERAKKSPGKIPYGSSGNGTAMHLGYELLKAAAGVDMPHVPYKGSTPAIQDALGGSVQVIVVEHGAAAQHAAAGKLKILALMAPQRVKGLESIPVVAETYPGVEMMANVGIVVPAATPRDIIRRINAEMMKQLHSPEVAGRIRQAGMEPLGGTPEEFDAYVKMMIGRLAKAVKISGAKAD
jgi:tripartite-type tricarboxylate transporter receptor subunit TctC